MVLAKNINTERIEDLIAEIHFQNVKLIPGVYVSVSKFFTIVSSHLYLYYFGNFSKLNSKLSRLLKSLNCPFYSVHIYNWKLNFAVAAPTIQVE